MLSVSGVSLSRDPNLGMSSNDLAGLGGAISPIVCQAVLSMGVPWFRFYFGSLVLSGLNIAFLTLTFRPTVREYTQDRENALNAVAMDAKDKMPSEASSPVSDPESPVPHGIDASKKEKSTCTVRHRHGIYAY